MCRYLTLDRTFKNKESWWDKFFERAWIGLRDFFFSIMHNEWATCWKFLLAMQIQQHHWASRNTECSLSFKQATEDNLHIAKAAALLLWAELCMMLWFMFEVITQHSERMDSNIWWRLARFCCDYQHLLVMHHATNRKMKPSSILSRNDSKILLLTIIAFRYGFACENVGYWGSYPWRTWLSEGFLKSVLATRFSARNLGDS